MGKALKVYISIVNVVILGVLKWDKRERDQKGLSDTYPVSLVILKYFTKKCAVLLSFLKLKTTPSVGVMNRLF